MDYKLGDCYRFPTSEGFETEFAGEITRITNKAVEFTRFEGRCKNSGHYDCEISKVCWLPKSVIKKNYIKYDDLFGIHIITVPFWIDVKPRKKHEFYKANKEEK